MAAIDEDGMMRMVDGKKYFLKQGNAVSDVYNKNKYHGTTMYCVDYEFFIDDDKYIITKHSRVGDGYHYSLIWNGHNAGESYTNLARIILKANGK